MFPLSTLGFAFILVGFAWLLGLVAQSTSLECHCEPSEKCKGSTQTCSGGDDVCIEKLVGTEQIRGCSPSIGPVGDCKVTESPDRGKGLSCSCKSDKCNVDLVKKYEDKHKAAQSPGSGAGSNKSGFKILGFVSGLLGIAAGLVGISVI